MIAMQNRIAPPATRKSPTLMPRKAKMARPRKRNPIARPAAVVIDWTITRRLSSALMSCVREMYMGRTPIGSTATKTGMKASRRFFMATKKGSRPTADFPSP